MKTRELSKKYVICFFQFILNYGFLLRIKDCKVSVAKFMNLLKSTEFLFMNRMYACVIKNDQKLNCNYLRNWYKDEKAIFASKRLLGAFISFVKLIFCCRAHQFSKLRKDLWFENDKWINLLFFHSKRHCPCSFYYIFILQNDLI